MSRSDNLIGHTNEVQDFLKKCTKIEKIGEVIGMVGEPIYDLYSYKDQNDVIWEEFIQYLRFFSGPVFSWESKVKTV